MDPAQQSDRPRPGSGISRLERCRAPGGRRSRGPRRSLLHLERRYPDRNFHPSRYRRRIAARVGVWCGNTASKDYPLLDPSQAPSCPTVRLDGRQRRSRGGFPGCETWRILQASWRSAGTWSPGNVTARHSRPRIHQNTTPRHANIGNTNGRRWPGAALIGHRGRPTIGSRASHAALPQPTQAQSSP